MASLAVIHRGRRWIVALLLGIFVLACLRFALVQDIWIDESTQLSGVRLPVAALIGWLGGTDANRFGVPGDRMPPLAYLLDHGWWEASGDAILRFRLFHILLAAGGVALIARTEIRALGRHWLGVGLAFLVLSPKLIEAAVELRSYPLFFAGTCALLPLFLDIVTVRERPPGWRRLLAFGAGCVLLSYVHFFGVVAAFAFFATLLLAFRRDRAALLRVLAVGAALAVCLTGLYPFVFGATSISTSGSSAAPGDIAHYLPLLFGHPASLIYPVAAILYFAASTSLLLAAAAGAARRARQHRTEPLDWLPVVAAIGCAATILPGFLISTFTALKPSYSIWLLPVFALVFASGAGRPIGWPLWDRFGRGSAVALLLIGATATTGVFLARAAWFVHGPHRLIEVAREGSPLPTAVIYGEPATFAYGYFPMVYQSAGRLPQYLVPPDRTGGGGIERLGRDGTATVPATVLAPYRRLIVVDIRARHYSDLRACLKGRCPDFAVSPLIARLVRGGHWSIAAQRRAFGFYDAVVTLLTADTPGIPTPPTRPPH